MAKNKIFTIGLELPGNEFESIQFESDRTLLDADIILFEPTLGLPSSYESYNGKRLLDSSSSFNVRKHLDHWRAEILAALKAGKLVIVYLARPSECYRHTGEKSFSGTGRSRVTTNIVTEVSSYEAIPYVKSVRAKSGTEIQIDREAKTLAPYWSEFAEFSPYEVEIEGEFSQVLLRSRSGDRVVGAAITRESGTLLFLPPLRYDDDEVFFVEADDGEVEWTKEAQKFGKRLVAVLGALAASLKKAGQPTPPPSWTSDSQFRLASEDLLLAKINECADKLAKLQLKKATLEDDLVGAGALRGLLFEQGKMLEAAIIEALQLLGFDANPYAEGDSEFDAVFVSPEGRCLGEAEGKDNKAINIDKFSQLERNLQEDFARDDVTEYAKGALFGNAYRLLPLHERGEFFTEKCLSAAKRVGAALIRTPDLFAPARYMKENPDDQRYAKDCRTAIFHACGEVVGFPHPPSPTSKENYKESIEDLSRSIVEAPVEESDRA